MNARDALLGGGDITLFAANFMIDEAAAASEEDTREGDYAVLCVADEGSVMSEEARTHAFCFLPPRT